MRYRYKGNSERANRGFRRAMRRGDVAEAKRWLEVYAIHSLIDERHHAAIERMERHGDLIEQGNEEIRQREAKAKAGREQAARLEAWRKEFLSADAARMRAKSLEESPKIPLD